MKCHQIASYFWTFVWNVAFISTWIPDFGPKSVFLEVTANFNQQNCHELVCASKWKLVPEAAQILAIPRFPDILHYQQWEGVQKQAHSIEVIISFSGMHLHFYIASINCSFAKKIFKKTCCQWCNSSYLLSPPTFVYRLKKTRIHRKTRFFFLWTDSKYR